MDRPPRWRATGDCIAGFAWSNRQVAPLPAPLRRVPGPVLMVAARYETSPLGPYVELAVAEPVRVGAGIATCVTLMVVDSAESRDAGRAEWSFPKQLGKLRWSVDDGGTVQMRWDEGGLEMSGRPAGPAIPMVVPSRFLQSGDAGFVRVSALLRGAGRLTTVRVEAEPDGPFTGLAGRHRGMSVTGGNVTIGPARPVDTTRFWTSRMPRRAQVRRGHHPGARPSG